MINFSQYYAGRRVLVTGHTGFKGSWLSMWLNELGAEVTGISLEPYTQPNLFSEAGLKDAMQSHLLDIRDRENLNRVVQEIQPEVIFHLAAQPLVRLSYRTSVETFATNFMGTVHLCEAVKELNQSVVFVHVGTDKCYENLEDGRAYKETDRLGGHDPYSASKGAAEIAVASYTSSFFQPDGRVGAASGRAGNVIGGGDWAEERIVPDLVRALEKGEPVMVRNPASTRPWQHVLEALSGYLTLGVHLLQQDKAAVGPWNFGPVDGNIRTVQELVEAMITAWGEGDWKRLEEGKAVHEAGMLSLDCSKSRERLQWAPRWSFTETAKRTAGWYKSYQQGKAASKLCLDDIQHYMKSQPVEG